MPLCRDQCEESEAEAQRLGGDAKAHKTAGTALDLWHLGCILMKQKRFLEAEAVLERAVSIALGQVRGERMAAALQLWHALGVS